MDEPGLPDARRAQQGEQMAGAVADGTLESLVEKVELTIPADHAGIEPAPGPVGGRCHLQQANGSNRLAVIVPCHRVVAAGGGLGGYGGGLDAKRWLLDLETGGMAAGVA